MSGSQSQVDELSPAETLEALAATPGAVLIDVRTRAEWAFTGLPDVSATGRPLWTIEWVQFPQMTPNQEFLSELLGKAGGTLPERMFFICRSGVRSMVAARTVAAMADRNGETVHCTNVAEGFEGDLDAHRHRGALNGWKVSGLPWAQS